MHHKQRISITEKNWMYEQIAAGEFMHIQDMGDLKMKAKAQ